MFGAAGRLSLDRSILLLARSNNTPEQRAPQRALQWVRPEYYKELKPERWQSRVDQMLRQDAPNPPKKEAMMFAGSTTIAGWDVKHYFPQFETINREIGNSLISDTTNLADQMIIPFKPPVIVFYSGDNDTAYGVPTEMIADASSRKGIRQN